VQKPGSVHRGQRPQDVLSHERCLTRRHRPLITHQLLQRPASDQFHPHANDSVDLVGAVHMDDVLVADAGEGPRFRQHARPRRRAVCAGGFEQLQRDGAVECWLRCPPDCAGRSLANLLVNREAVPCGWDVRNHSSGIAERSV
jgi:hypothetical protein